MSRSWNGPPKINAMSEVAQVFFMEAVTATIKGQFLWSFCELVEETIKPYHKEGKPLSPPTASKITPRRCWRLPSALGSEMHERRREPGPVINHCP